MDRREQYRHPHHKRQKRKAGNRHMHCKNEGHCLSDIAVDPPSQRDRLDDRTKVIVEQHDRGRLACDIGAAFAHRDPDMCRLE